MTRKLLLSVCLIIMLVGESAVFGGRSVAGLMRLRGERAYFRNHYASAWLSYRDALDWGGDEDLIETDMVEVLLVGLHQSEAGAKVQTALPPSDSLRAARELIAKRLSYTPYRAHLWSLVSEVYQHQARQLRVSTPLDLTTLSENPIKNFFPEDRLAVAALQRASELEPNNYDYPDLLTEMFLELERPAEAAPYCRRAVAALPRLYEHEYLMRPDLDPEIKEAAIAGFEEALRHRSMIPSEIITCDAGRLLREHGEPRRAIDYFRRAIQPGQNVLECRFDLGLASYTIGDFQVALEQFEMSAAMLPDSPWPDYYAGLSRLAMGQNEAALPHLRLAREKGSPDPRFLHTLGETLERTGQVKEAERQFVAAASLNPDDTGVWSALLNFYIRQNDIHAISVTCSRLPAFRPPVELEACASMNRVP
jgi:tetratricopeptide (TPR) repeat protein